MTIFLCNVVRLHQNSAGHSKTVYKNRFIFFTQEDFPWGHPALIQAYQDQDTWISARA